MDKIVCIGDSLTEGYGIHKAECWVTLLEKELKIPIVNEGISGDTSTGILSRCPNALAKHQPSILFIMGGTNDLVLNIQNEYIFSNLLAMTKQARHLGVKFIIGIPTPFYTINSTFEDRVFFNGGQLQQRILQFQESLKILLEEKDIPFIDFSKNMPPSLFLADGLHPNAQGHLKMMELVKEKLVHLNFLIQ